MIIYYHIMITYKRLIMGHACAVGSDKSMFILMDKYV